MKVNDKNIYDFLHYKPYLEYKVGSKNQRRGLKSGIAAALRCQPTYVSQVLHGKAHFSLEQADLLNQFLGHSKNEAHYFLLLVQKDRAGISSLRSHFEEQLNIILKKRMNLIERLGKKAELTKEDQSRYYSSWHFAALHIALTIPELQTSKALSEYFRLPLGKVNTVMEFLVKTGLAKSIGDGQFQAGATMLRLGNDSPNILKHHCNWRQMAVDSLDREELNDLHYSSVISLSKKDALKIKDRILDWLKKDLEMIKESKEEELYSYCIDFFHLKR